MLSTRNFLLLFIVEGIFYSLLLVDQSECAYRVDAFERARRSVLHPEAPIQRRQLDANHVAIRDLLGLQEREHMVVSEHVKTVQGSDVWRLHEKYMNLPVFDVSVTVSTDETGHLTGDATGEFVQGIEHDLSSVTPRLTDSEVFDIALKTNGDEQYKDQILSNKSDLMVYNDNSGEARLVYKVEYLIESEEKLERPNLVIDANTGEVLLNWNNLDTASRIVEGVGGNEKIGPIFYDKETRKNYMTQIGGTCFLENDDVRVIDMHHEMNENETDPVNFVCDDDYYDEINGAFSPALDAFYGANVVAKMFHEWYGMTPLGKQIVFRVHFGDRFENAFWDGKSCTFGDGGDFFYPLTSLDIAAHELGHGITERFSGLLYFDESGSINEAFSDMTGETAEAFDKENDWLIGGDVMKDYDALRYFDDPTADNVSLINYQNFTYDMNPHYGSGIYNHAFYLIVKDSQLPIKEAYEVFLLANRIYWHQRTTFTSGACDVMKAAYDLGKDPDIFRSAFESVGIEVCDVSKHVLGLVNNRTVTGIRVGPDAKPVFLFSYPNWGGNITIKATSDCSEVFIKASYGNNTFNESSVAEEGKTELSIELPTSNKIYIQLSTERPKIMENVHLVASYSCNPEYSDMNEDFWIYYMSCLHTEKK